MTTPRRRAPGRRADACRRIFLDLSFVYGNTGAACSAGRIGLANWGQAAVGARSIYDSVERAK
ncbi:MAG: hypothetical protein WD021_08245 [Rhodothermales bacterium]